MSYSHRPWCYDRPWYTGTYTPKPLRVIKPNPDDPDWKFPYASRMHIEHLRAYFTSYPHRSNWHTNKNTRALPKKIAQQMLRETNWPSVQPQFRPQVEAWFQKKLKQAQAERGYVSPGKIRSLRMLAARFGRYILTGRKSRMLCLFRRKKRIWEAYLEWERQQLVAATPKTASKVLNPG